MARNYQLRLYEDVFISDHVSAAPFEKKIAGAEQTWRESTSGQTLYNNSYAYVNCYQQDPQKQAVLRRNSAFYFSLGTLTDDNIIGPQTCHQDNSEGNDVKRPLHSDCI